MGRMIFNHRYDSHHYIIRNCHFHENQASLIRGNLIQQSDLRGNQQDAVRARPRR